MRVRAKLISEGGKEGRVVGYYGDKRIKEGQIFTLVPRKRKDGSIESVEQQFSKAWMEQVDRMPIRKTQIEKNVNNPIPQKASQITTPTDDPIGGEEIQSYDDQNLNDDTIKKTGSDEVAGQTSGSNSDVI